MILADQGADVIKVEPPGGDIARRTSGDGEFTRDVRVVQPRQALDRAGSETTRGTGGLAPADRRRRRAGAEFPPGTMERLGLDEPAMRKLNPGLIYVSISGVGDTGPYVRKRVYDPVIQSLSGFADAAGGPGLPGGRG